MSEYQDSGGESQRPEDSHSEPSVVRIPRPQSKLKLETAPEQFETVQGSRPGSHFLRLTRAAQQKLRRLSETEFLATRAAFRPTSRLGRLWAGIRRVVIGEPLTSSDLSHVRLSKLKALAIFSSDNLSSSAYATEEILLVLILAGSSALHLSLPLAFAIALLAVIVATSYRQLIRAYPGGGGAYVVTKQNLGFVWSLLTGATLFVDYILTVAVSTAAGVAAITSALPELHSIHVELAIVFVGLLTIGNLRGVRESGNFFAIPSYLFIFSFGGMILVGLIRLGLGHDLSAPVPADAVHAGTEVITGLLLMRAFASGAAALTGIEAIADGVPSFKAPESKNASTTLMWMAFILASFFLGTTYLAIQLDIVPSEATTVVAQIAEAVFGRSVLFYVVQVATAMILILAANTAFAGLPTLASVMAKDGVVPKQFAFRGDRLAFSNGIIVLGVASAIVLVVFNADTHKIIPLYALGVFLAFTLSQAGMVIHWHRTRGPGWRLALAVNCLGATVTAIVALIVVLTKFMHGAWLSMMGMALIFYFLLQIRQHYINVKSELGGRLGTQSSLMELYLSSKAVAQIALVPVDEINRATLKAVSYARRITPQTFALHVGDDRRVAETLRRRWEEWVPDIPMIILESTNSSLVEPIISYVEALSRGESHRLIVVVLPDFITRYPWQRLLHNSNARRLRNELVKRPDVLVATLPYDLRQKLTPEVRA